ncbi:MAG: peptidyl-prolyl cis-trans isomerase [Candidatus Omnitrophota bacterium]
MNVSKFFVLGICGAVLVLTGCNKVEPKKTIKAPVAPTVTQQTAATVSMDNVVKTVESAVIAPNVLAKVGDWTITKDEFNERIKVVKESVKDFNEKEPGAKDMLLQELVRQQLLIQQARKDRLDSSSTIKTAMKEFENTLLVQESVTQLTKGVLVSEDEANKYYTDNPNEFKRPIEKRLREIVVATQADANAILVQILQGADFAQLAKDRSKGKTAADGGALPSKTDVPFEAMGTAVANLKKGGVSSVFEGPEGYYIVKVEDIMGGDTVPLSEIKADLLNFLKLRKQQELLAEKIKEIRKDIKVQINENLLKE